MDGEDGSGDRILTAKADTVYQEKVGLTGIFHSLTILAANSAEAKFGLSV